MLGGTYYELAARSVSANHLAFATEAADIIEILHSMARTLSIRSLGRTVMRAWQTTGCVLDIGTFCQASMHYLETRISMEGHSPQMKRQN